jgi:phage gp45-like
LLDLIAMGYDQDLNLIGSRSCALSIHSETKSELKVIAFDEQVYEEAIERPVLLEGKEKSYANDGFKLFTKKNGYAGCSIAAQNVKSDSTLNLTMTVTGNNIMSHQGSLSTTIAIPPLETKIVHHIMPAVEPGAWSYKFSLSYTRTPVV